MASCVCFKMIRLVSDPSNTGTGHQDSLNIGKRQRTSDDGSDKEPPKKKGRPCIVESDHVCVL